MKLILMLVLSAFCVMLDALIPSFPTDPAISPDGLSVCFSWNGDLFRVPYQGGVAARLTSSPGEEFNPLYSPDGSLIAYQGSKDGYSTIYLIPALGGDARELPAAKLTLWAWFPYGKKLLVTDGTLTNSFLSLNLENGSLEHVAGLAGIFADVSIDGNKLVYCSDGDPFRKGYRGTLNGDLWEIDLVSQKYTRFTSTDYTERYPVYSRVNPNTIYYAAPSEGQFQLFRANTNTMSTPEQLTSFRDFSVRDISIATNSDRLVFEHFNQIMCWDDKTGKAKALQIEISEDVFPSDIQYKHCENKLKNCCVSPDGKWILFCQDYDLFAVPVEGGEVKQITQDQPVIVDFVILSDSRTFLLSTQDRDGHSLFKGDISLPLRLTKMPWDKARTIEKLGMDRDSLVYICYSKRNQPNRRVYYDSSADELMFEVGDERVDQGIISPDKKWLIYLNNETNANLALKIREIGKKESTLLATYKDAWAQSLAWSSDNRSLFVNLGKKIIRYDLIPENEYSHEKNGWSNIIGQDSDKKVASKPLDISMLSRLKNLDERGKTLVEVDSWVYLLNVESDRLLYIQKSNDRSELHNIGSFGSEVSSMVDVNWIHYSESTKRIFYTNNQLLYSCNSTGGEVESISFSYDYKYSERILNSRVFDQLWYVYKTKFYDPGMHGLDWDESYKKYSAYVEQVHLSGGLGGIASEMIGDINTSHSGFYASSENGQAKRSFALLGCEFDYTKRPKKGLVLNKVFSLGSLAEVYGAKQGDILLSLDGVDIAPNSNPYNLLLDKEGKKISFTMLIDGKTVEGFTKGLGFGEFNDLRYQDWVMHNREMVDQLSEGVIGYIHIRGMDDNSAEKFKRELTDIRNTKEAIIIDIRNNGGGWTHYQMLDELSKQKSLSIDSPGLNPGFHPEPPNVENMPKVLLTNQHCASAAEAFPQIFRKRKLGKIIGVGTQGAVIGTRSMNLIDGSMLLIPGQGVYTADDKLSDMEGTGVHPDIVIEASPEQVIQDDDVQLRRAINELMLHR